VNYIFEGGVLIIMVVPINGLDGRIMGSGVLCARGLSFFFGNSLVWLMVFANRDWAI
jgi:hypothetical protein